MPNVYCTYDTGGNSVRRPFEFSPMGYLILKVFCIHLCLLSLLCLQGNGVAPGKDISLQRLGPKSLKVGDESSEEEGGEDKPMGMCVFVCARETD